MAKVMSDWLGLKLQPSQPFKKDPIEIATTDDIPALLKLQNNAFASVSESLNWPDMPNTNETLEHAYKEFEHWVTLKLVTSDNQIIGSIRGKVENGSLYIGRLMVFPEYQGRGHGSKLIHAIEDLLPHNRSWLNTCEQLVGNVRLYERHGYRPFKYERINDHLTRVYLEKNS